MVKAISVSIALGLVGLLGLAGVASTTSIWPINYSSGLERDIARELSTRKAVVQQVSTNHFNTQRETAIFESVNGNSLEVQIERALSDRRIPFTAEYHVEGLPGGARVEWDFDHEVDSNNDGLFRNDADAIGQEAGWTYFTNRTPKIITARVITKDGREFTWEDKVSFNVQNGDRVVLDAREFLDDVKSVKWEVSGVDSRDRNFRISSPTKLQTYLTSRYPGVTHVILDATDDHVPSSGVKGSLLERKLPC